MDTKITRKQFLIMLGSLIGVFILSRIPGASKKTASTASVSAGYGAGSYGGKHSA